MCLKVSFGRWCCLHQLNVVVRENQDICAFCVNLRIGARVSALLNIMSLFVEKTEVCIVGTRTATLATALTFADCAFHISRQIRSVQLAFQRFAHAEMGRASNNGGLV